MTGRTALVIVALLAGVAPARRQKTPPPAQPKGAVVHGAVGAMLDRYLTSPRIFKEPFSGVALVALRGEVLLEKGYGTADAGRKLAMPADSIWDWASVTKQFTAAAVLKLEMQGKLSLDDSIRRFYPEAPTARRSSTTAAASGTSSRSTSGT